MVHVSFLVYHSVTMRGRLCFPLYLFFFFCYKYQFIGSDDFIDVVFKPLIGFGMNFAVR